MVECLLSCTEAQVEWVCDALEELGALSVSVEDADANTAHEQGLFGEPNMPAPAAGWQHSNVRALFEDQTSALLARAAILAADNMPALCDLGIHPVAQTDWVRLTQSQFEPIHIQSDFWIVPTWHDAPSSAKTVMRLDPGLAFGTGTHPTTRMCLQWLCSDHYAQLLAAHAGARVLDYGCGSGVLAIAAGLIAKPLGDTPTLHGVDLDPAAIAASAANAQQNGVQLQSGNAELAQGEYELVLANILATPLKVLAPLLCSHMKPGAPLVLAGILTRQADELKAAYAPWLSLEVLNEQDGWILMGGQRSA